MKKIFKYLLLIILCLSSIMTVNALAISTVACGNVDNIPAGVPRLVRNIVNAIKILVPVIIIVLGILDIAKSVMASQEKDMQEYLRKFTRRIIAGVAIFFVVAIVQFIFGTIKDGSSASKLACISCFISSESNCTYVEPSDVQPKKGCSSYSYTEGCPAVAEDGMACKQVMQTGSSTPKCVKACGYLSIEQCSKRSDCKQNGPNSCTDK